MKKKIQSLEESNAFLCKKVVLLESKINFLEQKEKQCAVDIVGLPDVDTSNVVESVNKLFTAMGEQSTSEDIVSCFVKSANAGIGSKSKSANIVCVKFSSLSRKNDAMRKMRLNRDKISNELLGVNTNCVGGDGKKSDTSRKIYMNDCLTGFTRSLLNKANELKRNKKCKFVWVRNSTVLIRQKEGDKATKIYSFEDLQKIEGVYN